MFAKTIHYWSLLLKTIIIVGITIFSNVQISLANSFSYWKEYNSSSTFKVNHTLYGNFLQEYVVKDNDVTKVQYSKVGKDKAKLEKYILSLATLKPSTFNKKEQKAYWINLYNALTILEILNHYPVKTIKEIPSSFFRAGPWDKKIIVIENRQLSLNNIENDILRDIFKDPYIHYALSCASVSCPNLATEPYTSQQLNQQLMKAADSFINNKAKGIYVDNETLYISRIYKWYWSDFEGRKRLKQHLQKHYNSSKDLTDLKIKYMHYDWSLNE